MPRQLPARRLRLLEFAAQAASAQSGAAPRELEITAIDSWTLAEPGSTNRWTVIRLTTRSGLAGWGESTALSAPDLDRLRRELLGKPAQAYERIATSLRHAPFAAAAADVALLDLLAKRASAPLYQFLGGPTRNKVRAMAAVSPQQIQTARQAGHRAFLIPIAPPEWRNSGKPWVQQVDRTLETVMAAEGDFVLDGAGALTPGDAALLAHSAERRHPMWIDEPCSRANLKAIAKIASETVVPLGFGRDVTDGGAFQELLREDAIDVLRPSIARNGITRIRRMAALAEIYYTAVAPYHDTGPVATAAALHLAASMPNFFVQQVPFPTSDAARRMRVEIAGPDLETVREGYFELPLKPGLGLDLNVDALNRYQERAA